MTIERVALLLALVALMLAPGCASGPARLQFEKGGHSRITGVKGAMRVENRGPVPVEVAISGAPAGSTRATLEAGARALYEVPEGATVDFFNLSDGLADVRFSFD